LFKRLETMNQQMGLREFFAMEAGEYLEQLDGIVSAPAGPDREEFLRLSRALRGSALMANQQPIGDAAAGLENLARALKENRTAWDADTRHAAVRALDDLKILVRSTPTWGEAENAKATAIATALNAVAGVAPPGRFSGATRKEIDAGTRAFVAREAATVASSLDQLARAFQRGPVTQEQFDGVFHAMQPLRGLAVLPELSPMPEFLDGVERAMGAAEGGTEHLNDFALLFDSAARGLSTAAKEITASGAARADSVEAKEFARRLGAILDVGGNIVPIQSLYFEDDGPHVLEEGTASGAPGRLVQLELVAHGEHLKQAADELDRAQWDTQRELRALALTATFRSLVGVAGGPLEDAVADFAAAAASAVTRRAPVNHTDAFVRQLSEAGAILSASEQGDKGELASRLAAVTLALQAIPSEVTAAQSEAVGGPLPRPPAPSAAMPVHTEHKPVTEAAVTPQIDEPDLVIPEPEPIIPDLEPEPPEAEPVSVAEQPVEIPEPTSSEDLTTSWARYEEVTAEPSSAVLSIDELLSGVTAAPDQAASVSEVELPEPVAVPADQEIVPITDLCYSGASAVERAQEVHGEIRSVLAQPELDRSLLNDLVEEILDLVDLGFQHQE
jgi:chemotaxis protein histidine kinase CheA